MFSSHEVSNFTKKDSAHVSAQSMKMLGIEMDRSSGFRRRLYYVIKVALGQARKSIRQPHPACNNDNQTAWQSPTPLGRATTRSESTPSTVSIASTRPLQQPSTPKNPPEQASITTTAPTPTSSTTMADRQLTQLLSQLRSHPPPQYAEAKSLLAKARLLLLSLGALTPSPSVPESHLTLARETYEQGALHTIRARDSDAFTRYVTQLAGFYALLPPSAASGAGDRNKVTGLYLLLLLTQGRYAEFHSELESLSVGGVADVESDRYLGYPVRLERWLMEGSYDRVWKAMKKGEVPCEEYGVFSEV
jgi:hypothetical protein